MGGGRLNSTARAHVVVHIGEPRRRRVLLAALSLLAAPPMLYMAVNQRLDYDGWWHVFIAREAPWALFWKDVYNNAHPPAFYLLLRAATELGSERVVYRSVSIVAAVVATYVTGRIATRVLRTSMLALPCALAFGLSMTTVVMASEVRSYMLAVALLLIAFRAYLDLVDPTHGPIATKTRVVFAVAFIGAITTHYVAVFFCCAAVVVPCLYCAVDGRYRTWWSERLRRSWIAEIATLTPIAGVVAVAYLAHLFQFRVPMPHVLPFFPDRAEPVSGLIGGSGRFLARSIVAEIDLFSPFPIAGLPPTASAVVLTLLAIVAIGLVLTLHRRSDWVLASAPIATLAILATAMMGASLLGRYPFGGALRHQFILFPFVVLSVFALADEIVARVHRQRVALAAVGMAVILNGIAQWRQVHFLDDEPGAAELATFDRYFGDSRAVYVNQMNLIYFFAAHQRGMWLAQSAAGPGYYALPVIEAERTLLVLRDMKRWTNDLADRQLYGDLRQLIALTRVPAVDLFHFSRPSTSSRLERVQRADLLVESADREGLRVERLVLDGSHLYARLRLDSGEGE